MYLYFDVRTGVFHFFSILVNCENSGLRADPNKNRLHVLCLGSARRLLQQQNRTSANVIINVEGKGKGEKRIRVEFILKYWFIQSKVISKIRRLYCYDLKHSKV